MMRSNLLFSSMFNLFSFLASRLKRIDDHCCYNNDHNCGEQIIVIIYITSFFVVVLLYRKETIRGSFDKFFETRYVGQI